MTGRHKIAWKPQNYEARVASVRIRCLKPLRALRRQGMPIELYRERHERDYRLIIFSKAYHSRDVELARRLKARGVKIVFDLCDNHFLLAEERVARLKTMFGLADHWVVSSDALAEVVREQVPLERPLTVIEDAVETELHGPLLDLPGRFRAAAQLHRLRRFLEAPGHREALHLVWFGNHKASYGDSGLAHMQKLRPLLERLHAGGRLTLTVISNSREAFDAVFGDWTLPLCYLDWSAHNFFDALRCHDVAVIPIEQNAFTRVKTNNRIALSLSLGLGVVADAIDSYQVFSACAFLDDWEGGLSAYLEDRSLIRRHADCAAAVIGERFSLPVIAARWQALIEDALAPARSLSE
ncbi:MAG TPA: hypothetical protein ENK12_03860 [Gammaproteobacteria bacterium]|nr:hypothetical protein [Gammaproteobacteria bacterium]